MPKVSVVIPFFNAIKYLPETIETVLQQTYEDYEIVVVNDGSSEDVEGLIKQLNHPKVRLINQENKGCSEARNTGIRQSEGEYVAFLDADDLWHPAKLEKQVQILDQCADVGLVYVWSDLIDEQGQRTGRTAKPTAEGNVWEKLLEENIVGGGSIPLVRRSCLEATKLFDPDLVSFLEDWDLWLRLAAITKFRVVPEVLMYYRQLDSSSSMDWGNMAKSYEIMIEKAFAQASPELQYKRAKSYGLVNLYLAWKPLKGVVPKPLESLKLQRKALAHYPQIALKQEFWRLGASILLTQFLGADFYRKLLARIYQFRRKAQPSFLAGEEVTD